MSTPQRTQGEGLQISISPDLPVCAYHLELATPPLSDLGDDAERLLEALEQQHQVHCLTVDVDVLRNLSPRLRSWN
jgi:hypothetical protein